MQPEMPLPVSGYVLAGGGSSRMGTDKAPMRLGGKPLIEHAVAKLRSICADVYVLGSDPQLASYAPVVPDLHPGCGPVGGIEAALAHTRRDWILILPVDVPFLPSAMLQSLAAEALSLSQTCRLAMFAAAGRPQPAICLLQKVILPHVSAAIERGQLKLMQVLEEAGSAIAEEHKSDPQDIFSKPLVIKSIEDERDVAFRFHVELTMAQWDAMPMWFVNLNTREDFALAEANSVLLET
jgi:molybdopterin-guanine dinucleotide biosynthesis protein A